MSQQIAILGTGANGSCTAADLTRAGHNIHLIDQWPEHVETMRTDGLNILMPNDELNVAVDAYHICDLASMTFKYDIVFLFTKAYDTRWACELIKPHLKEDGLLVGIQNGMTIDDIIDILGVERTLGCVVELSSEIFTPGIVQRNTPPEKTWFGIGGIKGSQEDREKEIAELLKNVGKVSISEDIISAKWMKLVINTMCLGPMALTGLTAAEALKVPGMRNVLLRVGAEALKVGQMMGYKIEPIFGLSKSDIKDTNRLLETLLDKLHSDIGPAARDCVLQDHLKGRMSEVDNINGLVIERGKDLGITTPANLVISQITNRIRQGELLPRQETFETAKKLIEDLN